MTTVKQSKGGRRRLAGVLLGLQVLTVALASADATRIEVILSQDSAVYWSLYEALQARLRTVTGDGVQIQARVMPTGVSDATLLVSAGVLASEDILARYPSIPAVATLLPHRAGSIDLARYEKQRSAPVTALYLDQPPDRYFQLIRAVLPGAVRVGVIYGSTSRADRAALQAAAQRTGFELMAVELTQENNIVQQLDPLLATIDVLLVPPDPEVSSAQNVYPLLLSTYRQGVPVIGFSAAYVKAGALAAVYSSAAQLGEQAAEEIARFLQPGVPSEKRRFSRPPYPADFEVSVNRHVARSLGLAVPDEGELYRELRAQEGRRSTTPP